MKAMAAAARRWLIARAGLAGRLPFEAAILMYHRFATAPGESGLARRDFAQQLDYLVRHFHVVPLAEALGGAPGRRRLISITVDDGYRSFADVAWPELRSRGLTAAVFLPTGFIDDGGWMWQDRNIYLLRTAPAARYRVPWRGRDLTLDTTGHAGLMAALLSVYEIGRRLDHAGRLELTATLERGLATVLPSVPPTLYAPLTWDQVRELQDQGVTFGSHTVNHAILTTLPVAEARREIEDSRALLAARLGRQVDYFVYPNGDLDATVRELTRRAGYAGALSTIAGYWSARGDPFAVPRLPGPVRGGAWLAGDLWNWWRRFGAPTGQFTSTSP
ncbi:MAG TPA: polysaccharide deacetylase family protein [Candidatus Krumholzibacteria bacterium]|nr:polysaccharide deacetylase family protein [Candidatus Krumholzibacteria bacterium]HPD72033.1 polysaccharide deacetylase family protein [Candidatus Krumholzibacteria bacterium]HRY41034.1 polysaccharide deacetylase family protein [Candidatus Krumholzibacteria bacterium]